MGTGEQAESESISLISCDGKEGSDQRNPGWGLVRSPCDIRVGVLEGREYGEEDLILCFLEVWVRGGGRRSKEQDVPRELGGVTCS